jgi:oxygen-independent coproporphyrinogen-3 oxidase
MAFYAQDKRVQGMIFESLFIGGGTPSILSEAQLHRLFSALFANFSFQEGFEATMEANPGSLTEGKIRLAQSYGIRRFSLGVQSFDDALLAKIGRGHTAQVARETIAALKKCQVENWNIDFIYGLPGQTLEQWQQTVQEAIAWQPTHLSLYNLIVEESTPFGQMQKQGQLCLPPEDEQLEMMDLADTLANENGYQHYEISNYCKPEFECRHNLVYWHNRPYLGLGTAAYSYLNQHRFAHTGDLQAYLNHWQEYNEPLLSEDEVCTPEIERTETILMGLRLLEGISYEEIDQRFHMNFRQEYNEAIMANLMNGWLEETVEGRLRLTSVGLPISNQVLMMFLKED